MRTGIGSKGQENEESLVEEESAYEHVAEQRKCSCWTRSEHRFGGDRQTTSQAFKTDRPLLGRGLAVRGQAKASPINTLRYRRRREPRPAWLPVDVFAKVRRGHDTTARGPSHRRQSGLSTLRIFVIAPLNCRGPGMPGTNCCRACLLGWCRVPAWRFRPKPEVIREM